MEHRTLFLGFLTATLGIVPSIAGAASLGPHSASAGLRSIDGSGGGRILDGTVPDATTPDAAFRAGLSRARSYFGGAPRLLGIVRSNDGTTTVGLFKATLDGAPVGGFVLTTYVPKGASRVDVLFDRVDRVNGTMHGLLAQAASLHAGASGGPAAAPVAVHDVTSPDGSVRAILPDGWRPVVFAQGQFGARGPNGEEVDQEVNINCVDPSGPLGSGAVGMGIPVPYSQDVPRAFESAIGILRQRGADVPSETTFTSVVRQAAPMPGAALAMVEGTSMNHGVEHHFKGLILVSPLNRGGSWFLSLKLVSAPASEFAKALPLMAAIYNSYGVDQGVRHAQVADTIRQDAAGMQRGAAMMSQTQARNRAVFDASMGNARSVQQSIDRSTSGFVHYLNDSTVLEGPGGRSTTNADFAQSVVQSDPQHFREVPVSEYAPGE